MERGRTLELELPDSLELQAGHRVEKLLEFPELVEPVFFLGKSREVTPPDVARVLGAGAGIDDEQSMGHEYSGALPEEARHVEVVDCIEGQDGVEMLVAKGKAIGGRSDRANTERAPVPGAPGRVSSTFPRLSPST